MVRPGGAGPTAATDLTFPPAIAASRPMPDVARDPRRPSADTGVEASSSTTTYDVTTTVSDGTGLTGYDQQTVTQQRGTISR